ncbi:neuropeptide prohormone-4-like [Babylonia areolata]|uniref:neuropeptide prohormone-4-like n=1 Tax=Babylonia areolata TaxID=304850 RepID=UPI003FD35DF9
MAKFCRTLKMSPFRRLDVTVLFAAIVVLGVHGIKIDLSGLTTNAQSLKYNKRTSCLGNPCDPSRPFLCRMYRSCVRLIEVCDGKWDCEDGFDEDPAVCSAVSRPPMDVLWDFLLYQGRWMIPALFNGADPEMVAHQLTVASSLEDLRRSLGLTAQNVKNLRRAVQGAVEGDERPLLALGMPDRAWPEVKYLLESLYNSGLELW